MPWAGFLWPEFPCFVGTIRTLRLPAVPPDALRFLRLAVPLTDACGFATHRRQATNTCVAGHIDHPVRPHIPGFRAETTGPPTFLGNPDCAYALLSDPGRTDHTRPLSVRRLGPRSDHDEGSCGNVSRGSITRPGHSLSTLRRVDHSTTTQDSLPAAGQALPDGIGYPQGSCKRFQTHVMLAILLFQAFLAQGQAVIGDRCGGVRCDGGCAPTMAVAVRSARSRRL